MNLNIGKLGLSNSYDSPVEELSTISNQIRSKLLMLSNGKKVSVDGAGTPIEIYRFGNESAKIFKRLHNGTVGEQGGEMRYYAEWADFREFDWWREALKKLPIYFLEVPVCYFAHTAGYSHPELVFSPERVIEHYHLNPKGDEERQIAYVQWVRDKVSIALNPLLAPDYKVIFVEGRIRLLPLTPDAIKSRVENNETYHKAEKDILNVIDSLKADYERMSKKK